MSKNFSSGHSGLEDSPIKVIKPEDVPSYAGKSRITKILADPSMGGGDIAVASVSIAPGSNYERHQKDTSAEIIYLVSGELDIHGPKRTVRLDIMFFAPAPSRSFRREHRINISIPDTIGIATWSSCCPGGRKRCFVSGAPWKIFRRTINNFPSRGGRYAVPTSCEGCLALKLCTNGAGASALKSYFFPAQQRWTVHVQI